MPLRVVDNRRDDDEDKLKVVRTSPQTTSLRVAAEPKSAQRLRVSLSQPKKAPQPQQQLRVAPPPKPIPNRVRVIGPTNVAKRPNVSQVRPTPTPQIKTFTPNPLANKATIQPRTGEKSAVTGEAKGFLDVFKGIAKRIGRKSAKDNEKIRQNIAQSVQNTHNAAQQIIDGVKSGQIPYQVGLEKLRAFEQQQAQQVAQLEQFQKSTSVAGTVGTIGTALAQGLARIPLQLSKQIAEPIADLMGRELKTLSYEDGSLPAKIFGSDEIQSYTEEVRQRNPDATALSVGVAGLLYLVADTFDITGASKIGTKSLSISDNVARELLEAGVSEDVARILNGLDLDPASISRYVDDIAAATDEISVSRLVDEMLADNILTSTARLATDVEDLKKLLGSQQDIIKKAGSKKASTEILRRIKTKEKELGGLEKILDDVRKQPTQPATPLKVSDEVTQGLADAKPVAPEKAPLPEGSQVVPEATPRQAARQASEPLSIPNEVLRDAPKGVMEKIDNGLPLLPEDLESLQRAIKKSGQPVNQATLPGFEELGSKQITTMGDHIATRKTPGGKTKSIAKGDTALDKDIYKLLEVEAKKRPSLASKIIHRITGKKTAKESRALINNIESIRRTNPALADYLEDFIYIPIRDSNAYAESTARGIRNAAIDIKKKYKFTNLDKEILADALDGKYGDLTDAVKTISKNADNPEAVLAMATEMRRGYEVLLTEINVQRVAAGKTPIKARKDYFPHIREMMDNQEFYRTLSNQDPEFIRRQGSKFGFEKQREGLMQKIEKDPFKVYDVYIEASKRHMASLVPARNIDLVEKALAEIGPEAAEWQKWMRSVGKEVSGLNNVNNIILDLQGRYAAGTIILNAGSSIKNGIQSALSTGITRQHAFRGLTETMNSTRKAIRTGKIDDLITVGGQKSNYLDSSFSQLDLRKVADKNILEQTGDAFAQTFYATDMFSRKMVVESFYAQAIANGMEPKLALKIAERQAEALLPSRTPGTLAPLFRDSTAGRAAGLFQTEVMAQAEALVDTARAGGTFSKTGKDVAANLAGMAIASYFYNQAYEQLFPGQRPAPDPIGAIGTAADKTTAEEGDAMDYAWHYTKEMLSQAPFVGSYFADYSRSPLSLPILEIGGKVLDSTGNIVEGVTKGEPIGPDVQRFVRQTIPFAGRGAKGVYRGVEGAFNFFGGGPDTVRAGDIEKMYEVDKNPANFVRMILGGSFNTPEAQTYFNGGELTDLDEIAKKAEEGKLTDKEFIKTLKPEYQELLLDGRGNLRSESELNAIKAERPELAGAIDSATDLKSRFQKLDNKSNFDYPDNIDEVSKSVLRAYKLTDEDVFKNSTALVEGGENLLNWFNEQFSKDTGFVPDSRNYVAEAIAYYNKQVAEKGLKNGDNGLIPLQKQLVRQVVDRTYEQAIGDIDGLSQDEIIARYNSGNVTDDQISALLAASDYKRLMGVSATKYSELREKLGFGYLPGAEGSGGKFGVGDAITPRSLGGKNVVKLTRPTISKTPKRLKLSSSNLPGAPKSRARIRLER